MYINNYLHCTYIGTLLYYALLKNINNYKIYKRIQKIYIFQEKAKIYGFTMYGSKFTAIRNTPKYGHMTIFGNNENTHNF